MSPILVRPVREQFEHDRIIRVLQAKYKRKYEVAINPGAEQNASVSVSDLPMFPDLVLISSDRARKVHATVEVETTESINTLEAMAEWGPFSRMRAAFYLYVPAATIDNVRRLCADHGIAPTEIWTYHSAMDQMRFTMVHRAPEGARAEGRVPKLVINTPPRPPEPRPATDDVQPAATAAQTAAATAASRLAKAADTRQAHAADTKPARGAVARPRAVVPAARATQSSNGPPRQGAPASRTAPAPRTGAAPPARVAVVPASRAAAAPAPRAAAAPPPRAAAGAAPRTAAAPVRDKAAKAKPPAKKAAAPPPRAAKKAPAKPAARAAASRPRPTAKKAARPGATKRSATPKR